MNDKEGDIQTVAEVSPNAAVTMAWAMVEHELKSTIMGLSISHNYPPYNSVNSNINLLKEHNLISKSTEKVLQSLMKLRNLAVHTVPQDNDDDITYSEAMKYYSLSAKVIGTLKDIQRR